MKVLCIDNSNKPAEIKTINWLELNKEYTVKRLMKTNVTGDYYFELEEVSPNCPPYMGYHVNRFAVLEKVPKEIIEEVLEI